MLFMDGIINRIKNYFVNRIWEIDTGSLGSYSSFIVKSARLLYVALREFTERQLNLRAMGLVYTVLLAIVPLLALSFSVLKAFGVHNQVEPILLTFLAPLGEKAEELTKYIIGFVENIKVGVLGSLGLALLIYSVISVIQKLEKAFNSIWRIKRSRSFARTFSDYTSVILIGPVLIFTAIGLTTSFMSNTVVREVLSIEPFGMLFYVIAQIIPYIFVCAAFTFIYIFVPNTKVNFSSAFFGGVFAGVLWEATGWAFASFVVTSTRYTAIYSGFAIIIMFLIWLYLSWLILLVGAQVSFYHQYPQFIKAKKEVFRLSNRLREKLAFSVMFLIGYNYYHNKKPWTFGSLLDKLGLPVDPVQDILELLEQNELILETHDNPPAYMPAKDISTITLKELLNSVRMSEKDIHTIEREVYNIPEVDEIIGKIDNAAGNTLGGDTVKSLVVSAGKKKQNE